MTTLTKIPVRSKAPSRPTWQRREPYEIADTLIEKSIFAERTYLASLWLNPPNGHDAACDVGLTGAMFTTEPHSFLFMYVCRAYENGATHSVAECSALSKRLSDADWDECELRWLILETDTREGSELLYAEAVADYYRNRVEAQQCLRRFAELGATDDYEILTRPRTQPGGTSGGVLYV